MGVSISLIPQLMGLAALMTPKISVSLAIVFTLAFLLHELAHKLSAQRFGLWAEFRLTMLGALITLISMLLPFFKIISPGAVVIVGPVTRENAGKTALSGPLTNIVLSTLCIMITVTTQNRFFWTITVFGAWINAIIAFFNLIPFGVMDGLKVFMWNKIMWVIMFVLSIALMMATYPYFQWI
jgi:Zn-dependent protease